MEKTIKMSLETARGFYKGVCEGMSGENMKKFLLENFTESELEGKKGFIWEDGFNQSKEGYYISADSEILQISGFATKDDNKNVFKTEKQALSALAFSQLSHIVAKYNDHPTDPLQQTFYCVKAWKGKGDSYLHLVLINTMGIEHLAFYSKDNAETSLEVNRQLWEQYWMI